MSNIKLDVGARSPVSAPASGTRDPQTPYGIYSATHFIRREHTIAARDPNLAALIGPIVPICAVSEAEGREAVERAAVLRGIIEELAPHYPD